MNKRIDELAKQAGWGKGESYDDCRQCSPFNPEEFAELIVKECAQVSEDDITDGDACCTNTAYRISRKIKKHFGVK